MLVTRPQMAERALRAFAEQTYENKCILVYSPALKNLSIGCLRNIANSQTKEEILIHWDDDDWSHPNRIAEQVALLQTSAAEAVGYRELLFWRTTDSQAWVYSHHRRNHALGTSLCYWRRTWERKPFADLPTHRDGTGEDHQWRLGLDVASAALAGDEPRMIASIHPGNTSQAYDIEALLARGSDQWRRAPEYDGYCSERMKL